MPEPPPAPSVIQAAGERALKNTTTRVVAELIGKLSTFLLFAVLARETGQSELGVFVFALAFLQIGMVPIGAGSYPFLLREVARDRSAADRLFFDVLGVKLALAVPVIALCFAAVSLLGYGAHTRETVYLLSIGLLLEILGHSLHSLFNATEQAELIGISLVAQRVLTAALGIAALAAGYGVVTVAAVYSIGAAFGVGVGAVLLKRRMGLPRRTMNPRRWRRLVAASAPFAVQDVVTVLIFKVDAVILSLMASSAAVGRYGAAYRVLESTMFVAWALNGAFAAMYAYLGHDTEPTIRSVFQRSVKLSLVILVPAAVAIGVLAEPISRLAFGEEFESAAAPLRLLAPVVVGLCIVVLTTSLLMSRRNPKLMVAITASMVVLNVVLNVILIPHLADSGSALAMLVTEVAFVAVALWVAAKEVRGINWPATVGSPALAGALMAAVMLPLVDMPALALVAGTVTYVCVFAALERVISPKDFDFIVTMVRRRLPTRVRA